MTLDGGAVLPLAPITPTVNQLGAHSLTVLWATLDDPTGSPLFGFVVRGYGVVNGMGLVELVLVSDGSRRAGACAVRQ